MKYKVVRPVEANAYLVNKIGELVRFGIYEVVVLMIDDKEYTFWPQEIEKL